MKIFLHRIALQVLGHMQIVHTRRRRRCPGGEGEEQRKPMVSAEVVAVARARRTKLLTTLLRYW